ncbi:MAG: hypothetical protein HQK79_04875 [Desulfobacterales bacterium]|nr:hypothetical protein [Desulfobacterales bacterium]MBF0395916.1 hypothetical protein [Desulfobacterales bacterium]
MNILKYSLKAFLFHWNLLFVGSGASFGIILGYPDIVLPILGALEVIYIALLATNTRFQSYIDRQEGKDTIESIDSFNKADTMLISLKKIDRDRFNRLKNKCIELSNIAEKISPNSDEDPLGIKEIQINNINKLLWIYLKLLFIKNAMDSFFATTKKEDIEANIEKTKDRLLSLGEKDDIAKAKQKNSLQDTLTTLELRLKNYKEALENYDFIGLEIDRLDSKIASIAETSINRQEPDIITGEIDVVSHSIKQTEKAMTELGFISNLSLEEEDTPYLLTSTSKNY